MLVAPVRSIPGLFIRLLLGIIVLLPLTGCGGGGGNSATPVGKGSGNSWTVMVYMDADNDLDVDAPYDLQAMQQVGSTDKVTVLVQTDTRSSTTKRYKVEKGSLKLLKDLGELDMSEAGTLKDFIVSSAHDYPAQHYALVLWDHGNGWKSILVDTTNDGTNAQAASNVLVSQGIQQAEAEAGIKLDILGVDACIMATLEAAYQFRKVADYLVASQEVVQAYGWDYRDLLWRLTANPAMSPQQLAASMVQSYGNFVQSLAGGAGDDQTMSAIKLGSDLELLASRVNGLALSLMSRLNDPATRQATLDAITALRGSDTLPGTVQEFDPYTSPATYVDLYDFCKQLEASDAATSVHDTLASITVAEYHGPGRPKAHGLSIVFFNLPEALSYSTPVYDPSYTRYDPATGAGSQLDFINRYQWADFMHLYFSYRYPALLGATAGG